MLVYEKKVNNARKLFGTLNNVPADADVELTYKDASGAEITPVDNDSYVDGGSSLGVQRISRLSDDKAVNVYIGDTLIIGDAPAVVAKAPKVESKKADVKKSELKKAEEKPEEVKELVADAE